MVPWLVLGEKSSSGVLNLESLPKEHRPRFSHIAAMKKVHTLSAENVRELGTILCTGKMQTIKFTDQQT